MNQSKVLLCVAAFAVAACGGDDQGPSNQEANGVACGIATCAKGARCCDHCTGTCVPEESGAFCVEDNEPNRQCDAQACGPQSCDVDTEVCLVTGPFGPSVDNSCVPVPEACQAERTCDCLYDELCPTGYISCTDSALNEIFCDNGSQ